MSRKFLTPIDLSGLELQNAVVQNLSSAPSAAKGRIYFDTTSNVLKVSLDGSTFSTLSTGGGSFTLGSTSISLGATVTTVAGLTLSSPTFTGTVTTPLTTSGVVLTNGSGVLSSVATLGNTYLTNSTISGVSLGSNLNSLTISTGLTGTSYNGSSAVTISLATAGTTGTYTKVTTDVYGRVTSGTTLSASDIPASLTSTTSVNGTTIPSSAILVTTSTTSLPSVTSVNGTTIPSSATLLTSTSTSSALTSVGTLTSLTMGGNIAMGSNKITGLADPTSGSDAATKNYVDNVAQGVNAHDAVRALISGTIAGTYAAGTTTANPPGDGGTGLNATITYSATGATTVDTTITLAQGDRVLVTGGVTADAGSASKANGIYVVTTAGTSGVATILTRAIDYDNSIFGDITAGDLIYVTSGTTYGGTQWVQTNKGTATTGTGAATRYCILIGTDSITFTQFSGNGAVPFATTSTAGIAKFNSTNFTVDGVGGVNTIQDISAASTPTFAGLTVGTSNITGSGALTVQSGGTNTNMTVKAVGTGNVYVDSASAAGSTFIGGTSTYTYVGPTVYFTNNQMIFRNSGTQTVGTATTSTTTASSALAISSGAQTGTAVTGAVSLKSGNASGANSGSITIDSGTATGNTPGAINIGNANSTVIGIGNSGSTTTITGTAAVASLSAGGFVKAAATTGQLSAASIAFSDLPTSSLTGVTTTGIARKTTGAGTGTGTSISVNHGFGQWVTAQLFDSSGNLVEVDVQNTTTSSGTTTFTFASSQTLSNYQYVIIG